MTSPDTYGDPAFYAGVDGDEVTIHLQTASETKRQPGHEPQDYAYGMRDFNVHDLGGNDLCFGMESTTESTPS
jgi:hypothetical protein